MSRLPFYVTPILHPSPHPNRVPLTDSRFKIGSPVVINNSILSLFFFSLSFVRQEMSSLSRSSPHTPRVGNLIKHQQMLSQQETSFTTPTPMETDATVAKINAMFPTASEHHIRLLLKK
jgi:hypothetical protein